MTTHELARYLLELDDRLAVIRDDDGFFYKLASVMPVVLSGVDTQAFFVEAKTKEQRISAFTAIELE